MKQLHKKLYILYIESSCIVDIDIQARIAGGWPARRAFISMYLLTCFTDPNVLLIDFASKEFQQKKKKENLPCFPWHSSCNTFTMRKCLTKGSFKLWNRNDTMA